MRSLPAIFLTLIVTLPLSSHAQDYNTLLDIPQGATLVNLSATERNEVEQDLLIATLRFEAEDPDPKVVQDKINSMMKKAVDAAKKVKSIKVSTQQYSVYEFDRTRGKSTRRDMAWRGQQGLQIKGKVADELLKLSGELQKMGLAMNDLSYTISPELLENTRNAMLEAAIAKLKTKAERTAKALSKTKSEFLQINVDSGGNYSPMRHNRSAGTNMLKMEMAAPVAEPGESQITLTVSAQALLR